MKPLIITTVILLFVALTGHAQEHFQQNREFTGAVARQDRYRAIYQMDSASPEIIKKTIRNINNLLEDPRLKGKVQVELIAFSGGTEAYRKGSEYEEAIGALVARGVLVAQCLNTLEERNIPKSELYDFLAFVPTGNGELLIRASAGWVIIKP
ncbi:MAG: DsrE family protein [Sphingobacterium sp.]